MIKDHRISIYTTVSEEISKKDGRSLFKRFMEIMDSPPKDYYDGTLDIKLKALEEDGKELGF